MGKSDLPARLIDCMGPSTHWAVSGKRFGSEGKLGCRSRGLCWRWKVSVLGGQIWRMGSCSCLVRCARSMQLRNYQDTSPMPTPSKFPIHRRGALPLRAESSPGVGHEPVFRSPLTALLFAGSMGGWGGGSVERLTEGTKLNSASSVACFA